MIAAGWTQRADGVWVFRCPRCGAYGETTVKPAAPVCGCGQKLDFVTLRIARNKPAS
jgi:ABC-type ATPase with predicted acetyltransferase domain